MNSGLGTHKLDPGVRRSRRSAADESVCGCWSKHLQWLVKVSGVTAAANDCQVKGVNYLIELLKVLV